jgi:hypothetical protein
MVTGLPEVIVATTGGASTRYVRVQGQILAIMTNPFTKIVRDEPLISILETRERENNDPNLLLDREA